MEELESRGFRIELVYPADEPHTAVLTRGGESVRLTSRPDAPRPSGALPRFRPEFRLTKGGGSGPGRAGMRYRDLIPGRLGGHYIASQISIADGGPVPDWVHFHRIAVQLICVHRGWVRVVYEDQGEPFVMHPGDVVLQPPGIRHRVLESSAGLEVVELTCPALHETCADHETVLPTGQIDSTRTFAGQRFLRFISANAPWIPFAGGEAQETGLGVATGGLAEARIVRACSPSRLGFGPHDGELVFGFVLDGSARLERGDGFDLEVSDSFVIEPGVEWSLGDASADFRLLHVTTSRL